MRLSVRVQREATPCEALALGQASAAAPPATQCCLRAPQGPPWAWRLQSPSPFPLDYSHGALPVFLLLLRERLARPVDSKLQEDRTLQSKRVSPYHPSPSSSVTGAEVEAAAHPPRAETGTPAHTALRRGANRRQLGVDALVRCSSWDERHCCASASSSVKWSEGRAPSPGGPEH